MNAYKLSNEFSEQKSGVQSEARLKRLPDMDCVHFFVFLAEEMLYLHSCDDDKHCVVRVRTISKRHKRVLRMKCHKTGEYYNKNRKPDPPDNILSFQFAAYLNVAFRRCRIKH